MKRLIVLVLTIFLSCGSCFASGYISDGWFGGKPVTPPVTPPPVTPPPPVQTTTTEYGTIAAYAVETDWYFAYPVAKYGKFDLYIGDKKYTISMAYKDSQVEVRNSETRLNKDGQKVMVVIAPASFRDKKAYISYPSGGTPTVPPVTPPVTPPADGYIDTTYQKMIHHFNPESLIVKGSYPKGRGSSMISCVGDRWESLYVAGEKWHRNSIDENREWWTNIDYRTQQKVHAFGEVLLIKKNGAKYRFTIPDKGGDFNSYRGDCFGKR